VVIDKDGNLTITIGKPEESGSTREIVL